MYWCVRERMATMVQGAVPTEELALHHSLTSLPEAEVECERVVRNGEETVMPLIWVRYADRDEVELAFADDPSVSTVTCLSESGGRLLYRMEWGEQVGLLLKMLTNSEATVLDAHGQENHWTLRVLYPERDEFSKTHSFCAEHGLTFDVETIRELDSEATGRFGLTDVQYKTLMLAVECGYYEVPRKTTLEGLADELDVSHQALSERLRRATRSLVENALLASTMPDGVENR